MNLFLVSGRTLPQRALAMWQSRDVRRITRSIARNEPARRLNAGMGARLSHGSSTYAIARAKGVRTATRRIRRRNRIRLATVDIRRTASAAHTDRAWLA